MTIFTHLSYLEKHRFAERQIQSPPSAKLAMIIVIPCHNEPDLLVTLDSLEKSGHPSCSLEVIVVINAGIKHPESIHQQNLLSLEQASQWLDSQSRNFSYHFLHFPHLPKNMQG